MNTILDRWQGKRNASKMFVKQLEEYYRRNVFSAEIN